MSNTVIGNYIGTNISGTAAISNTGAGVTLSDGASYNHIGGLSAGERNLISGNGGDGIEIRGSGTMSNTVSGNYIGTDSSGMAAIQNSGWGGVSIGQGASYNRIGGSNATPGGNCTGECNVISGNGNFGVFLSAPDTMGNIISGNFIGTNLSGSVAIGNASDGIHMKDGPPGNRIGGSTAGERNIISGNGGNGISLYGSRTMSNTVSGNYIGTDTSGMAAIGNQGNGIGIGGGAHDNDVGGSTTGERNVISGNHGNGIHLYHSGTMSNTVVGNFIGTNIHGMAAISNTGAGVTLSGGASYNRIGGLSTGERNVISGNGDRGVVVEGSGTMSNVISGNFIGTDGNGTTALGNGWMGIDLRGGAQANTVGGRTAGERNVISSNGFVGVGIWDAGTNNNSVIGNFIGTNVSGAAKLGNKEAGVRLGDGPQYNTVGGATSAERNIISGNGKDGIEIGGAHNNHIVGNYIGTDVSGTAGLGNSQRGIGINEAGGGLATRYNTIEKNVISGNGCNGVDLYGADTVSNTLKGNLIGTDAAGTSALGNGCQGIWFGGGAHHNTVGGSTAQDRNVISGNNWGVGVEGDGTTNNTVAGNFIGINASGTAALGNNNAGVVFYNGSQRNVIKLALG